MSDPTFLKLCVGELFSPTHQSVIIFPGAHRILRTRIVVRRIRSGVHIPYLTVMWACSYGLATFLNQASQKAGCGCAHGLLKLFYEKSVFVPIYLLGISKSLQHI